MKLNTEVDIKYFKEKVTFWQDITPAKNKEKSLNKISQEYIYEVNYNQSSYLVKGFKVNLARTDSFNPASTQEFEKGLSQIIKIYQDFHFAKTNRSQNTNGKPLFIDHKVAQSQAKDLHSQVYIEILCAAKKEYYNQSKYLTIGSLINFMYKLAKTLSSLNDMGISLTCIDPDNIAKNPFLLKEVKNKLKVFAPAKTAENLPPETKKRYKKRLSLAHATQAASVYLWGMTIYKVILENKQTNSLSMHEEVVFKDHEAFLKSVMSDFNSFVINKLLGVIVMKTYWKLITGAGELICDALKYEPKKRPSMSELVDRLRKLRDAIAEKGKNLKAAVPEIIYVPARLPKDSKPIVITETLNESNLKLCSYCLKMGKSKVELSCGHTLCKICFMGLILQKGIIDGLPHLSIFCSPCSSPSCFKKLTLDCGCDCEHFLQFSTKENKCSEGHELNSVDACLLENKVTLECMALMAVDYSKEFDNHFTFDAFNKMISSESIDTIVNVLKPTKIPVKLDLGRKKNVSGNMEVLCEELKTSNQVIELNIGRGMKISTKIAKKIARALRTNRVLKELSLSENNAGNEGMKSIAEALRANRRLEVLHLVSNQVGNEGAGFIGQALKISKELRDLKLKNANIGYDGAKVISEAIKTNKVLTRLDLGTNNIGDSGAEVLSEAIRVNKTLKLLKLEWNNISEEGGIFIGGALKVNKKLAVLSLGHNSIGNETAKIIGEALMSSNALLELNLKSSDVRTEGVESLCEGLLLSRKLIGLNLKGVRMEERGARAIGEVLKYNKVLKKLNLKSNNIKNTGAEYIYAALNTNTALEDLNLSWNNISGDIVNLWKALKVNKTLKNVILSSNSLNHNEIKAAEKASGNPNLKLT